MKWVEGWQSWKAVPGVSLDVFCACGPGSGKTILVTGAVHGDEYEGPAAILDVIRQLREFKITGRVIAVPVVNPPALLAGTRLNPEDNRNLARCFPGRSDGSPTEQLAYGISKELAGEADYLIDLHSGGVEYLFLPLAGWYGPARSDNPSFEAARHFGLPYVWDSSSNARSALVRIKPARLQCHWQ